MNVAIHVDPSEVSGTSEAVDVVFSELALGRRGALALAELEPLASTRASAWLTELSRMQAAQRRLGQGLRDELYALVPGATPQDRQHLIDLQRAIHNERALPSAGLDVAERLASPGWRQRVAQWVEAREREAEQAAMAAAAAREELLTGRVALARLAAREDVARALQLSGEHIVQSVDRYVSQGDPHRPPSKAVRHAEATLASYLYRMALKTSPFGWFTELFVHGIADEPVAERDAGERRSLVRLSRVLLDWAEQLLTERLDECHDALLHWFDDTACVTDGKLELLVREEKLVRLPITPPVALVLDVLAGGIRLRRKELVEQLCARGLSEAAARGLVGKLVEVGVLRRGLGLPDHEPDYARALADAVGRLPGTRAASVAARLHELHALEQGFAAAGWRQRAVSLEAIEDELAAIATIVDAQPLAADEYRSLIYEDVACSTGGRSWDRAVLEGQARQFELVQRLLPLLDQARLERLALYELFAAHFGPAGTCKDLVELYRVFAQQPPSVVSAMMTGTGQPWARELFELRRRLAEHLDARLADAPQAEQLELDETWVSRFVEALPAYLEPWGSAAYGLQFFRRDAGGPGIVVNNAMPGHGWAFSRFCDLFEGFGGVGPSLRERVRARIREQSRTALQVDVIGVFGMNANLHPRLSDLELLYPGATGADPREDQLSLRDVALIGDPVRRLVRAVRKRDGAPLRLVAHNFLFPAAAPSLYRFLCALSEFINVRGSLWSAYLASAGRSFEGPRVLPRLSLGRLVLERRSWTWPTRELTAPQLDGYDPMTTLRVAEQWRVAMGLPREGFFRFTPSRGVDAGAPGWLDEMRSWALTARTARLHKPHYIRFDSSLLCGVLFKQLRSASPGAFSFHESLPATSECSETASAEEFYVEVDLRAAGGARSRQRSNDDQTREDRGK